MASTPRKPVLIYNAKDARAVSQMASYGMTLVEIARVIGMSQPTLQKLYMRELETGHLEANAKVAAALFKLATHPSKPNVQAIMFWCRVRMGWSDKTSGDEDIGKKAAAELLARAAEKGSEWDGLLATGDEPERAAEAAAAAAAQDKGADKPPAAKRLRAVKG